MEKTPQKTAFVFPGQGSQIVGMAQQFLEYPPARELFQQADDALEFNLSKLMREGPAEELTQTHNAQPALLVAGLVAFTYLSKQSGRTLEELAACVAGHSLGEYTAVAAAGGLGFTDAVRLVRLRGQAMAKVKNGGMCAVLGLEAAALENILPAGLTLANDNAPGQVILSGPLDAVVAGEEALKAAGAKRVLRLNVSGPFHTAAMAPAAEEVKGFLQAHPLAPLTVPCVMNATAAPARQPAEVAQNLAAQVTSRVRWRQTMEHMAAAGITNVVELGVGKVLAGLAPRCDVRLTAASLESPEAIDTWLESRL